MKSKKYSDEDILLAIKGDDIKNCDTALKQLYSDKQISDNVKELVRIYTKGKLDTDDILQEAIMLFYELVRSNKFEGKSKINTFINGICRNLVRNHGKRIERIDFKETVDDDTSNVNDLDNPENQMILVELDSMEKDRDNILNGLLDQLSSNCQEVLLLFYFHAKSMAQIAEERNLKNSNMAKKAASRCREQLRALIRKQPHLEKLLKVTT